MRMNKNVATKEQNCIIILPKQRSTEVDVAIEDIGNFYRDGKRLYSPFETINFLFFFFLNFLFLLYFTL